MRCKGKENSDKRVPPRYILHEVRMAPWVESYDRGVRLEGLAAASRAVNRIKDFLAAEFPHKTIPHTDFNYRPVSGEWIIRIPLRKHICLASEQVAMITGLSRMMILDGYNPIPDD